MPNWYNRQKNRQDMRVSKFLADIKAIISIPKMEDQDRGVEVAEYVLKQFLPESNDASQRTAIDATVNINIEEVVPYE